MNNKNIGDYLGAQSAIRPYMVRLPKPGHLCPYTGISRSKMNQLILPTEQNHYDPPVKSISMRNPGQRHAVRLIEFESLVSYLKSLDKAQRKEVA